MRSFQRQSSTVHGMQRPGSYVRSRQYKMALWYVLTLLGSILALFVFVRRGPTKLLDKDLLSIALTGVVVVGTLRLKVITRSFWRLEAGASSEVQVGRLLERSKLGVILHGLDLGVGGDADHIVVGETLAVIETKTGRGHVRADGSKLYAGSKALPGSPVSQAKNQARAVRKKTGMWATAVVCVTGMNNEPFRHQDVIVCSMRDLPKTLRQVGGAIPDDIVPRVLSSLGVPNLIA